MAKFEEGDLVFIRGDARDVYSYTVPGSWGYVQGAHLRGVEVEFVRYGDGESYYNNLWDIANEHLAVIPEPPETEEAITALVDALTKLTA